MGAHRWKDEPGRIVPAWRDDEVRITRYKVRMGARWKDEPGRMTRAEESKNDERERSDEILPETTLAPCEAKIQNPESR